MSNCKSQGYDFNSYLNNFGQGEIPIYVNDNQAFSELFCQAFDTLSQTKTPRPIPEYLVAKYICIKQFCDPDGGYFRYDYGIKVDFDSGFRSVLISKLQFEGDNEWDFDLRELLLINYNSIGDICSRQYLTKDNDRWKSQLTITNEGINVLQIKIIEPIIDQYHHDLQCEFWRTSYQITKQGSINTVFTSSVSSGIVFWDKLKEEYVLKE